MKHLLLLFFFSGSLDSFSQVTKTLEYPPKPVDARIDTASRPINAFVYPMRTAEVKDFDRFIIGEHAPANKDVVKPDTLRAIVLVTLSPNGIAHSRMGFVVISEGKRPVYLDCNKKDLKLPQVGWGYEVVNPNNNQK